MDITLIVSKINGILWTPLYFIMFFAGLYFTIKTKGLQISKFPTVFKNLFSKPDQVNEGSDGTTFSPLQAVATSLSGAIGTGNIVGIASAILTGGPGALYWLWIMGFLGMIIKYAEIVISLEFRSKNEKGEVCGGPMFYMENGLNSKFLAILFAAGIVLGSIASGNIVQINAISSIVKNSIAFPNIDLIIGGLLALLFLLVMISGTKGIAKISEIMTPIFCGTYVIAAFIVIFYNFSNIPYVFSEIFKEAFNIKCFTGGALGYSIISAIRYGVARGIGCGEIGIGTGAIAHGSSNEKDPKKEGLLGIFETFLSMLICTITILVLLVPNPEIIQRYNEAFGQYGAEALTKMPSALTLITNSFATVLGTNLANIFMIICIFLFAFTTVISFYYYGLRCYEYIFGCKTSIIFKIIFCIVIVISPFIQQGLVWELNDLATAILLISNMTAVFLLRKKIF